MNTLRQACYSVTAHTGTRMHNKDTYTHGDGRARMTVYLTYRYTYSVLKYSGSENGTAPGICT